MPERPGVDVEASGSKVCSCGAAKKTPHDLCTTCAWEQGWDEARVVSGADEVYGPYAGAIRDRVASCADYLGRITRQLSGTPSRHYVAGKAHALRDAAGRLIGTCHDIEGWLRSCGEVIHRHDGEDSWTEECVLEAGHCGAHYADAPRSTLEIARTLAEKLAEASVGIADHLGWIAHTPGRLGDPFELEDLGRQYEELRRKVDRLSPALAALRNAQTRWEAPEWLVASPGRGPLDESEILTCPVCEFEATSPGQLGGHREEAGH